jgi:hypothetical protein
MKALLIEISEDLFERICQASSVPDMQGIDIVNAINAIKNGTPLDTIKAEITEAYTKTHLMFPNYADGLSHAYEIFDKHLYKADFPQAEDIEHTVENFSKVLDNKLIKDAIQDCEVDIRDKAEKKSCRCNTCKNNDDELSGECYECVKNIQNHYEPKENEEV